jgi:hypothetical protein
MIWQTLEMIWLSNHQKIGTQVRFNDWNHAIKYFTIQGESSDGKRLVGILDTGERISYPKKSRGWELYTSRSEEVARAV